MLPEERDAAYLWDMLQAALETQEYIDGISFYQYSKERMRQRAIERAIEIIGEAARNVSQAFKDAHDEIPWRQIIAQRNILAHEYGEILQERLWRVAIKHIPALISQLEPLIPSQPPPPD